MAEICFPTCINFQNSKKFPTLIRKSRCPHRIIVFTDNTVIANCTTQNTTSSLFLINLWKMAGFLRTCLQSLLKLVNSVMGMAGIMMIIYSLWMLRVWFRDLADLGTDAQPPWFIYTFFGLGVVLCVITCSGHVAAETGNGHCLSCYMVFVFVLLVLEAAILADVFLNNNWEDDLPEDQTGRLDDFKDFVKSNFDLCKWIGLLVLVAQSSSFFLAIVLRALGSDQTRYYDSDEEYTPARLPLLVNHGQPSPYVLEPQNLPKTDPWKTKV